MDAKDLQRRRTELERQHARAMEKIRNLEQALAETRTTAVRIEGAHALIVQMQEDLRKEKEVLPEDKVKPDAPNPEPEEDALLGEVVEDDTGHKIIQ